MTKKPYPIESDQVVTLSEAAARLYGDATTRNLLRVRRLAARHGLTVLVDMAEANPRHRTRLLKNEVEALAITAPSD